MTANPAPPGMTAMADVLIIGGGIFGLSCAIGLARAGKKVTILDKTRAWGEASAVNAGSLGVQNKLPALVPYTLWAWDLWEGLAEELGADLGLKRNGGYKIAMTEAEAENLHNVAEAQIANGLQARSLTRAEIAAEAPWLSPQITAARHSLQDGYASPTKVGPALRRKAEALGITIVEGATVTAISTASRGKGDVLVEASGQSYRAAELAITAGAWSAKVARLLGVHVPISLDVNMVSVTEPARPTIGCIVTHARGILTLKQVANGSCLIGGGWQGIGSLDNPVKEIDYDQITHNVRLAISVIPGLAQLNVLRSWAGFEGVTPDSYPYLGHLPGYENVYLAACARGGFTLGPLMGRLLSELILTGQTSRPIDIFNPARFAHAAA